MVSASLIILYAAILLLIWGGGDLIHQTSGSNAYFFLYKKHTLGLMLGVQNANMSIKK